MSVIKNLKIFSLIFALAGCGSANLETPDGISVDQEGIWAFDTWGDDCSNEVSEHPRNFTYSIRTEKNQIFTIFTDHLSFLIFLLCGVDHVNMPH